MLLECLGASLLGNLLTGKGAMATSQDRSKTLPSRANMQDEMQLQQVKHC